LNEEKFPKMLKYKNSTISPLGIAPELLLGVMVVNSIYDDLGIDCVITSITDGKHMEHSRHYLGDAIDIRCKNIPTRLRGDVYTLIKSSLTTDYNVVWEARGKPQEHFHISWKPRRR
jgi:hypothetical protein